MKTQLDHHDRDEVATGKCVYVRRLIDQEVEELVNSEALDQLDSTDDLFAVLSDEGQPLAILKGREAAFALALANELNPMSVH